MGVDVDGLACPYTVLWFVAIRRGGYSFLLGAALSHCAVVGGGAFLVSVKPSDLDILCSVDCLGTCVTESYMEKLTFTRACLSYVRVIMIIMRVSLVEWLCHMAMGQISTLEYMLPGACGLLWTCTVASGNKCRRFPRPRCR
jgi:hypothetical protein